MPNVYNTFYTHLHIEPSFSFKNIDVSALHFYIIIDFKIKLEAECNGNTLKKIPFPPSAKKK